VAGRHHLRVLHALGRVTRLLDIAQPDFDGAHRAVLRSADGDEIWHVCTPTPTHLDCVRTLIAAVPRPRIILEKPIGRPGESKVFQACAEQADIVVQSQYNYARVVEAMVRLAGEEARTGPLEIGVVFRKKRAGDGRFVDGDRHALGYEGFHQLAIGLRLVEALRGVAATRAFAGFARLSVRRFDAAGFDLSLEADGVRMELSSALDRDPRSAVVELTDRTGRRVALHFETNRWRTDQPRQLHAIYVEQEEVLIEEDLMQTGILTCLCALEYENITGIARNQVRALEIEALLDRASEAAGVSLYNV
jgi:hypothetical protein